MLLDELLARLTELPEQSRVEALELATKSTATIAWVPNPGPQTQAFLCEADELFYGGEAGGGKTDLGIGLALTSHKRSLLLRRINKIKPRIEEILGHDNGYNGQLRPTLRIIAASYADSLAVAHSNDFRRLVQSKEYKRLFPKTCIDPAKNTESEVRTTKRGFRLATSVGGALTGRGGRLIIVDDPIKPDDAASDLARRRVIDWYEKTLTSRLDNKSEGAIILVMQRLHVDDLAGHLLEAGGWDYLGLPAIAEIEEEIPLPRGCVHVRRPGELLFPGRESQAVLDQLKREMSTQAFSAQYQQQPVPVGGGMIQWSWFKFYTGKLPEPEETVISWDTASKKTELSDYSVGTVWGRFADQYVLLDLVRGKYAYPELKRVVTQTSGKYPNAKVLIEDAGSGTSLIQDLHADGVRVQAIRPLGDKIVRMSAQTARIEEGRVHLPESASWLEEFRSEVMAFPNGRHDDQVDSLAQALAWFTQPKRPILAFG